MTDTEILERIQKVYDLVMGKTDLVLTPGTKINRNIQISSFVLIEFIMNLEEEFDIELPNSEIRSIKKVQNLIDIIKSQL